MSTKQATPARKRGQHRAAPANGNASNGNLSPEQQALAEAIAFEDGIAQEATTIRGQKKSLDGDLFMKLLPLLRKPIPQGFIQHVGVVTGKPYESTGVKSLQVLIDRMNNVLTPMWWRSEVEYHEQGKLARVRVIVGDGLLERESWGGVDRGSTLGNVYKGSETNAAKRAFAAVGPGHEVYLGATDLDPDVSAEAAAAQEQGGGGQQQDSAERKLPADKVEALTKILAESGIEEKHLKAKLRGFGVDALEKLTVDQGIALYEWISGQQSKGSES